MYVKNDREDIKMIDDYLYTVGKQLPSYQKEEVLKEIETNIYDYLAGNFGQIEYDNAQIKEALRAMGPPKKLAEAYMGKPRMLIDSIYIDTYWLIIRIAVIASAIGLTISGIISVLDQQIDIAFFLTLIMQIFTTALTITGMVTLIFILISKFVPNTQNDLKDADWSLDKLDHAPKKNDQLKVFDLIIESFFMIIALIVINNLSFLSELEGLDVQIIPVIDIEAFSPFIIFINILIVINLLMNVYLLIKGRWHTHIRIISVISDTAGIVLLIMLATAPQILDLSSITDITGVDINFEKWAQNSFYILLAVILLISIVDIVKHIRVLVKQK